MCPYATHSHTLVYSYEQLDTITQSVFKQISCISVGHCICHKGTTYQMIIRKIIIIALPLALSAESTNHHAKCPRERAILLFWLLHRK